MRAGGVDTVDISSTGSLSIELPIRGIAQHDNALGAKC